MLREIGETEEVADLESLIGEVVERPNHLSLDWLDLNAWSAVPTESANYFAQKTAQRIAYAGSALGETECYAVATEAVQNTPLAYRLSLTTEALVEFGESAYPVLYVLLPRSRKFAILCTPDYHLVAGPRSFVVDALGMSLGEARSRYAALFTSKKWPEHMRVWYEGILERYERFGR